jgi:plastocyanin
MLGRRLLVLMAVLLGLTALVTALAPRPTVMSPRGSEGGRSSAGTTAPAPAPGASRVVSRTVEAASGASPARVRARAGDTIRLSVRGKLLDTVELQGLDEIEPLAPEAPARFEFLAETPGEHAIVLLDADRRVGLLDIRARAR